MKRPCGHSRSDGTANDINRQSGDNDNPEFRAAVLAAANPTFGRYDELKSPGENIDFSTTILSRFDMIFYLEG